MVKSMLSTGLSTDPNFRVVSWRVETFMTYSIVLFVVLFVIIGLMRKSFDIHANPETWFYKFHDVLENVPVMWFMITLDE